MESYIVVAGQQADRGQSNARIMAASVLGIKLVDSTGLYLVSQIDVRLDQIDRGG